MKLTEIMSNGSKYKIMTIFSNFKNQAISYTAIEPLRYVKESKSFIVFESIDKIKLFETGLKLQKEFPKPIQIGEAYTNLYGNVHKIKTILNS